LYKSSVTDARKRLRHLIHEAKDGNTVLPDSDGDFYQTVYAAPALQGLQCKVSGGYFLKLFIDAACFFLLGRT